MGKTIKCSGLCGLLFWSTDDRETCPPCTFQLERVAHAKIRAAADAIVLATQGRVSYWRARIIVHFGGLCACCATNLAEQLTLDHLQWSEADRDWSSEKTYRAILSGKLPTDRFQLLCSRCNTSKGRGPRCTLSHQPNV